MALPTQKRSKSHKRTRQYQYRLKKLNLVPCPKCKKMVRPHHVCPYCGTYVGREVIKPKPPKKQEKTSHS